MYKLLTLFMFSIMDSIAESASLNTSLVLMFPQIIRKTWAASSAQFK